MCGRPLEMIQHDQVFKLKTKGTDGQPQWAYRYRLDGRGSEGPQVGGFATRAEAEAALCKGARPVRAGGGRATITLAEFVGEYLEMHQAAPVTIAKLRWLLGKATTTLGEKRLADLLPRDVYAWRLTVPEGHRFEATQALRQVLNRAVAWGLLDNNPAKLGQLGVVYVRRAFANGRLKHTKTRLSTRAVPLQAKALDALDRLPASDYPILFPSMRGGLIDFRIFGRKHWRPAQAKAGIEPVRGLYDLRHTYATFALRACVPVFAVSRFMGTSIAMIDRHYGHLANDSRDHAVALLDALAFERAVDAAWTSPPRPASPLNQRSSRPRRRQTRRVVDARWTPRLVSVASTDD